METPKVSVIMSVYKEPVEWLRQSVDSILNQTFRDFEFIIICDNPHYEEGISLLNLYAKQDERVKLILNEENIGLTRSLNKGLHLSRGGFIARMDADDISCENRLSEQYDFMMKYHDVVACGTNRFIMDEKGDNTPKIYSVYSKYEEIKSVFLLRCPFTHPTVFFRKEIVDKGFLYDETFECAQDYNLWGRLIAAGYKLTNIEKKLIRYRVTPNQISNRKNKTQIMNSKRTKKLFLENLGIILSDEELDLLLLPNENDANPKWCDFHSYVLLLRKIEKKMLSLQWFSKYAYRSEMFRSMLMLSFRCKNKWLCIAYTLSYGVVHPSVVNSNKDYIFSRL